MCSYLIFLTIIMLNMNDYLAFTAQTVYPENNTIKRIVMEDRKDCKIEQSDQLLYNAHLFDNCADRHLPIVDTDFFKNKEYILCVGYYEVLYGICEFNVSSINMIELDGAKNKNACNSSHNIFDKVNITHKNIKMEGWFNYVKEIMSNITVCQSLCIFLERVDPKCTMLMNLFNYYLELVLKNSTTPKPLVPINVKELTGVVQITDKGISLPTTHQDLTIQKQQSSALDHSIISQTPNEVKTESVIKQSNPVSNTMPEQNTELPENNKVEESVQEKSSVKPDETPIPSDVTNKSLQPQMDLQPEDIKENEPVDGFDKELEGIPPSGGKEFLADNSFDNKLLDNKIVGGNADDTKLSNQLNPSAILNDGDNMDSDGEYMHDHFKEAEDSNFFVYFLVMTGGCIVAYVLFHNRNKLVALALEGRKGRSARARGGGRHSSASYSKLHSNLEEAIASNTTPPSATNVLY